MRCHRGRSGRAVGSVLAAVWHGRVPMMMEHGSQPVRCRICTSNDREALVEGLAADLWETQRHGTLDDRPCDRAGDYWQRIFRSFAEAAIETLRPATPEH
jgi:hypothetical protein